MSFIPEGTLNSRYRAFGDAINVDVRAGLELSHRPEGAGIGKPNYDIADRLLEDHYLNPVPIYASFTVAMAIKERDAKVKPIIFDGLSAHGMQENTGTFGELSQLKRYMLGKGLGKVGLYHHANNMGVISRQARMLGIDHAIGEGMTTAFDPQSDQWWTQSLAKWRLATIPRLERLATNGHFTWRVLD